MSKVIPISKNITKLNSKYKKAEKLLDWGFANKLGFVNLDLHYVDREGRHECDLIGYISHKTQPGCINKFYETAVIQVGDRTININPDYLKSMQRKDFKLWFQKGKHGYK